MGLLQKDLPVSLCPSENNPEGIRIQGKLQGVNQKFILVSADSHFPMQAGLGLSLEFWMDRSTYRLETTVARILENGLIALRKPKVIHKSRLREGTRVPLPMRIHFTPWADSGRFEAELQDISETGIRMIGRKSLKKDALVSLDFYIKEARARIISQGMVVWCNPTEQNEFLFESGVQFTTLSNETRKKLSRHLERMRIQADGADRADPS